MSRVGVCIATGNFISGCGQLLVVPVNGECVPHTLNPGIYPGDGDADGDSPTLTRAIIALMSGTRRKSRQRAHVANRCMAVAPDLLV